jgi:predicted nucleic acid-binding protein
MIGQSDIIIAATALSRGFSVVTFNISEFRRVPGLAVIRPDWPQ